MKQLADYPTPEVEAELSSTFGLGPDEKGFPVCFVTADFARNLERRLAMCQDALEKSQASNKRRKTELHRLNNMLRLMWDGVRFSHKCRRDMENKSKV